MMTATFPARTDRPCAPGLHSVEHSGSNDPCWVRSGWGWWWWWWWWRWRWLLIMVKRMKMTSMMMIIVLYDNDQHWSLSSSLTMRMMWLWWWWWCEWWRSSCCLIVKLMTLIPCNQDINNDERQGQDCKNSSNWHGYEDLHLSAFCNENGLKFSFEWL